MPPTVAPADGYVIDAVKLDVDDAFDTVTVMLVDAERPDASVTVAVSVCVPFATVVVFQDVCSDAPEKIVVPSTATR